MNRIWKIKKFGKLKLLISYFLVIIVIFLWFTLYATGRYGGGLKDNLLDGLWIYSLFIIAALIYPPSWIIKKKIATKIELDVENKVLIAEINQRTTKEINFTSLSYSIRREKFYSVLVFFKEQISPKTGNQFYTEQFQVLGNQMNILWKLKDLNSIEAELRNLKINKHNDDGRPLIDYVT